MKTALALALCLLATAAHADPSAGDSSVLVVVGAGGTAEYDSRFQGWAAAWRRAAERGGARFRAIGLDGAGGPSDHQRLRTAVADEVRGTGELWVVLLGHGTFDGRTAKFNLRGPDVSASELAAWLAPVTRPTVVINASSASAPFLATLAR